MREAAIVPAVMGGVLLATLIAIGIHDRPALGLAALAGVLVLAYQWITGQRRWRFLADCALVSAFLVAVAVAPRIDTSDANQRLWLILFGVCWIGAMVYLAFYPEAGGGDDLR